MDWECLLDPKKCAVDWVLDVAQDTIIGQWVAYIWESIGQTLIAIGTLWIQVPTPSLTAEYSPAQWISQTLKYATTVTLVGSLLICGAYIAWTARHEPVKSMVEDIFKFLIVSGGSVTVLQLLIELMDYGAQSVITSVSSDADVFAKNLIGALSNGPDAKTNLGVMFFVGILALIANIVQIVLMLLRSVMLMLSVGFLPVIAAVSVAPGGEQWLKKALAWIAAFLLYKPVAAIIYGAAIKMITADGGEGRSLFGAALQGGDDPTMGIIAGGAVMVIATFALPGLIAFLVPATSAVASNGGGGSGLASAGMIASGAVSVTGSMRGMSGTPSVAGGPSMSAQGASQAAGASSASAAGGPASAVVAGKKAVDASIESVKGAVGHAATIPGTQESHGGGARTGTLPTPHNTGSNGSSAMGHVQSNALNNAAAPAADVSTGARAVQVNPSRGFER